MTFKSPSIHRTPLYRAKAAYANMLRRCGNKTGKDPAYTHVKLKMSLQEWLTWALPRYKKFQDKHPNKSPNVSRKGDKGHYEIGNIRIVSQQENKLEQKFENLYEDVEFICPQCGVKFLRSGNYVQVKQESGVKQFFCSTTCSSTVPKKLQEQIRRLHSKGLSSYKISQKVGVSRNTVMKYW